MAAADKIHGCLIVHTLAVLIAFFVFLIATKLHEQKAAVEVALAPRPTIPPTTPPTTTTKAPTTTTKPPKVQRHASCERGWVLVGIHRCFKLPLKLPGGYAGFYERAAEKCRDVDAKLAKVDSEVTQMVLIGMGLRNKKIGDIEDVFIGLRTDHDGNFLWDGDAKPMMLRDKPYVNFAKPFPKNATEVAIDLRKLNVVNNVLNATSREEWLGNWLPLNTESMNLKEYHIACEKLSTIIVEEDEED